AAVTAFPLPRFVPDPCHGAHTPHQTAADQAHDVDLMRSLVEHDPAAHRQLVAHARPVHEFVVVPAIDHAELAQLAALDDFTHFTNRPIEAMCMTTEKLHAIFFRRLVHGVAFRQRHRHGFFDD